MHPLVHLTKFCFENYFGFRHMPKEAGEIFVVELLSAASAFVDWLQIQDPVDSPFTTCSYFLSNVITIFRLFQMNHIPFVSYQGTR